MEVQIPGYGLRGAQSVCPMGSRKCPLAPGRFSPSPRGPCHLVHGNRTENRTGKGAQCGDTLRKQGGTRGGRQEGRGEV